MSGITVETEAPIGRRNGVPPGELTAKLYGVPGSAPSTAAELMLQHKRIQCRRVNLIAMLHRRRLRAKGFTGVTVPALVLSGQRVQTNRAIARALDELVPEPPLFPADPLRRAEVEDAERFGDEVLQHATRRIIIWCTTRDPDSVQPHPANGRIAVPRNAWLRARIMPRVFEVYGISEEVIRRDFETLPSMLDRMDAYVAGGVLNAPQLTAADFQIAPLIGALMGVCDIAADVAPRPIAALAARVLPRW